MSQINQPTKSSLSWRERALLDEQIISINYNNHKKSLKDEFSNRINKKEGGTS